MDGHELDVLETGGLFLNSAHGIGTEFAQSGEAGPSIFPVTSLALRLQFQPTERLTLRAAVLDATPGDPQRPKRTTIDLDSDDGALAVVEAAYRLPGDAVFKIGHWEYTADFDPIEGGAPEDGSRGTYASLDGTLYREVPGSEEGLRAFLRYGVAAERFNPMGRYLGAGLVYTGLFPGRDADQLGLAAAVAFAGDPYRRVAGAEDAETNIVLTYAAQLTDWLTVQPNIQYIIDPGLDPALDDALVLGLRLQLHRVVSF